ncbi:RidA family protein [Hugenholtzia roseola]|uniref:RidA family protein n=1 Tax=Hugenholtzia roseola TaxID=1002 RepID=UPI0003FE78E4|nr:RidA family protein [Hugenholtzia roseola]
MAKKIIYTKDAPAPIGAYNQAVLVAGTLYVSGQIAIDSQTGNFIQDSIEAETEQVMKNLAAVLKAADMGFEQVVKCSIFIKNMDNFARINEVYGRYFNQNAPARETVEVSRLPKDAQVEISCIATAN